MPLKLDAGKFSDRYGSIGIDLGLNHFAITSDGSKFDNPRWLNKHDLNLKIKQQRLSRRKAGSQNRNKARLAVAKIQTKIARCREDFLHKLSRRIVNENQVICVENLNVKGMIKKRCDPAPPAGESRTRTKR